jgi:ribosomal protein S18 acetylase RimI-like enzyme
MNVRRATEADEPVLRELWEEFEQEIPPPAEHQERWDEEWADVAADIGGRGAVFVAEDDEGVAGAVRATMLRGNVWHVVFAYVRPRARRQGALKQMLAPAVEAGRERGSARVTLGVLTSNQGAVSVWRRLGFEPFHHELEVTLDALAERLRARAASSGSVYVQSDDHAALERAVRQFVPRLGRSEQTEVLPPRDGWIEVRDELCSREPTLLRRLARELSDRSGAVVVQLGVEEGAVVRYVLYERGRIADEYASIPEYHGPLPPGDVVALNANPTVAARLTGADPGRVREVARTASSPSELPPPDDLRQEIADVLGLPRAPLAGADSRRAEPGSAGA